MRQVGPSKHILNKFGVFAFLGIVGICAGCREHLDQEYWEQKFASDMIQRLQLYETLNPRTPVTNMAMLFSGSNAPPYPWWWHDSLARFGKTAGFSNSLIEKYVIAPPGMTSRWIKGHLRLIAVHPFPSSDRKPKRSVIIYTAEHYGPHYEYRMVPESRIQETLAEQNVSIPPPDTLPVGCRLGPRPAESQLPLHLQIHGLFERLISFFGGDANKAWILRDAVFCILAFGLLVFSVRLARRVRRAKNDPE